MAANIKGPAIFLAQFAGDTAPFNSLPAIAGWAASLGYRGVQIPTWDARLFDLDRAATSKAYCDEVKGVCREAGVEVTELSTHLQGQLVAVNPAYEEAFDAFAPPAVHGKPKERQAWAVGQVNLAAKTSQNLGLSAHVSFPGALAWPYVYPWPQRPQGLVETAFAGGSGHEPLHAGFVGHGMLDAACPPIFSIGDDELEMGVGIHGEPGGGASP